MSSILKHLKQPRVIWLLFTATIVIYLLSQFSKLVSTILAWPRYGAISKLYENYVLGHSDINKTALKIMRDYKIFYDLEFIIAVLLPLTFMWLFLFALLRYQDNLLNIFKDGMFKHYLSKFLIFLNSRNFIVNILVLCVVFIQVINSLSEITESFNLGVNNYIMIKANERLEKRNSKTVERYFPVSRNRNKKKRSVVYKELKYDICLLYIREPDYFINLNEVDFLIFLTFGDQKLIKKVLSFSKLFPDKTVPVFVQNNLNPLIKEIDDLRKSTFTKAEVINLIKRGEMYSLDNSKRNNFKRKKFNSLPYLSVDGSTSMATFVTKEGKISMGKVKYKCERRISNDSAWIFRVNNLL